RAHQANCLASAYMQVDVFEDMNTGRAMPEREIDAGQCYGRSRLGVIRHGTSFFATPLIWDEYAPGPAPCAGDGRTTLRANATRGDEGGGTAGQHCRARRLAQRGAGCACGTSFCGETGRGPESQRR